MKAGHPKTRSPHNEAVSKLAERVTKYRLPAGPFDYASRGAAVTEAHDLYNTAFRLSKSNPYSAELRALSARSWALVGQALSIAFPPEFDEDCRKLEAGDVAGMESAICFLEADPMFFRTGYVKDWLIRHIKPAMLTPAYVTRMQQVVPHVVDTRDDRDFRAFCRLARKADGPELRAGLEARLASANPGIRRRAGWVLDALKQKDQMEKGRAWKPKT